MAWLVGHRPSRSDLLVIAGFIRPWVLRRQLRVGQFPPDPIVVIGHWRSGTTYLHQLLASDPAAATVRNSLMVALEPLAEHRLRELLGVE